MTLLQLQEMLNNLTPEQLRQPARALNGKEFYIDGLAINIPGEPKHSVRLLISERKGA